MEIVNNVLVEVYDSDIKSGKVVIPDGVTKIQSYAFDCCHGLKSVTIPGSVMNIGHDTFRGCRNLTSVTIGNGVVNIEKRAFAYCFNLKNITIPDSVTSIGWDAFYHCDELITEIKAYKAFQITPEGKFKCLDKIYEENKLNFIKGGLRLCNNGIHYCTNLFEIFDYYHGEIDKYIAIFEIKPGSKILKSSTSKCCTNSCRLVKRLYREDIIRILNGKEE